MRKPLRSRRLITSPIRRRCSAIAVVGATSPSFCHLCLLPPSLLLLSCQRYRRHASYCRHPALNYRHFALNYRHLARVRSKVEFVARIGDCQVSYDNCPPCRHRFKPRNQHKRSLRPRRFGKSVLMPARTQWQHTANPLWMVRTQWRNGVCPWRVVRIQ